MREQKETIYTDPVTGGQKGEKPCRMDLIPAPFVWELGEVYGMGARKYADHNWAKGYKWSCSIAALFRHLFLWLRGERLDRESGLHHLAHVAWHCGTLFMFENKRLGTDDRLPAQLDKQTFNPGYRSTPTHRLPPTPLSGVKSYSPASPSTIGED